MFLFRGEKNVLRVLSKIESPGITALEMVKFSEKDPRWRYRLRRGSVSVWISRLKDRGLVVAQSESEVEFHARLVLIKQKLASDWKRLVFYSLTERGREVVATFK
jgi:DNA-binding MarR family transcriptional regulator